MVKSGSRYLLGTLSHGGIFNYIYSIPYNCILGRPTLNQLQAKVSAYDLSMKVPSGTDVQMIYCDHKAAQEYYFATVKAVERVE